MRPSGWVFMLGSWGLITGLTAWCIWRLLRAGGGGRKGS